MNVYYEIEETTNAVKIFLTIKKNQQYINHIGQMEMIGLTMKRLNLGLKLLLILLKINLNQCLQTIVMKKQNF